MTDIAEMRQHARTVRLRLIRPPNAVTDIGIDLKRRKEPPPKPLPPEPPLVPQIAQCIVHISELPAPSPIPVKITTRMILTAVSRQSGVGILDLKGPSRIRSIVAHRQIAMYLLFKLTTKSSTQIGRDFNRDHSTCIHGKQKIGREVENNPHLAELIKSLEDGLRAGNYD